MSFSCSLSESSSGCSCAAPAGRFSHRLRENAFPFPAQPLVYYAGVPELYSERRKEKSDKPNCFVKAFRWYTQEHGAKKSTASETKDVGFANWLDHKYQQYLCDNQLKNATFKSEAYVQSPTTNKEPATRKSVKRKGFQRVMRYGNLENFARSPIRVEIEVICNSSWQILLRPKSLSHLQSDTCAKKQSSTYGACSRVNTVTSSDTQMTVRTYSKRLGIVVREVTDFDMDNGTKENNSNKVDASDSQNTYVLGKKQSPPKTTKSKIKVKCECPVEINQPGPIYNKNDASTQYDPNKNVQVKPLDNNVSRGTTKLDCCKSTELVPPDSPKDTCPATKEKHIQIDTGDKTKHKSSCACGLHTWVPCRRGPGACNNMSINHKLIFQNRQECQRSVCANLQSANGSAQTSDYAIIPTNVACGLPLLLRVLPARQ